MKLTAIAILLAAVGILAEEATNNAPPGKPKLDARFYQQDTPYAGEITRCILVAQASQFSFVLPAGFRRQVDPVERKVSLISTSYTCAISAMIHETATDGAADLKPDTLRVQVSSRHEGAKIVDEFTASIESMSGPGFELEWKSEAALKMTTRAVFVPYAGGHLEFSVQAPASEIRQYDQALNQLMLSFRTSPIGADVAVQEFLPEL